MVEGRLLLLSWGLGAVPTFLGGNCPGKRLAFVPTAGDVTPDRSFLDVDRAALRAMGLDLREVDLNGSSPRRLVEQLADVEGIFVTGGTAFYLLDRAIACGFGPVVKEALADGVPYIGQSAGAVVAGPDIAPLAAVDAPETAPGLVSTAGLGLVDFVVLPHAGVGERLSRLLLKFGGGHALFKPPRERTRAV